MAPLLRKTALVTGGTDGIGKEVARGLARRGHEVILVGRHFYKGMRAVQDIRSTTANEDVWFLPADLSLMSDTRRLAEQILHGWSRLHYLVHSAGVVRGRRILTTEGIESNFAVGYLSRFALTSHLLPLLEAAGDRNAAARIVIIGGAAQAGRIYFDDVSLGSNFTTLRAVGQFCQANDAFTLELSRRLATADPKPWITVTCLKVGVVKTNIRRGFPIWMKWFVPLVFDPLLGQTPERAAHSALQLLFSQEFEGVSGALFLKIRKFRRIDAGSRVIDPELGRRLWNLSEQLTSQAALAGESKRGFFEALEEASSK